jgi:hypothetical protein
MPQKQFDAYDFHKKIKKLLGGETKFDGVSCEDHSNTSTWTVAWNGTEVQADRDAVAAFISSVTNPDDLVVPDTVSKYQFKRALIETNQLNNVLAVVD